MGLAATERTLGTPRPAPSETQLGGNRLRAASASADAHRRAAQVSELRLLDGHVGRHALAYRDHTVLEREQVQSIAHQLRDGVTVCVLDQHHSGRIEVAVDLTLLQWR